MTICHFQRKTHPHCGGSYYVVIYDLSSKCLLLHPECISQKKNSQVFQKLSTKNTLEILELLLYIEWSQTFQKYLKQQNIFQLSQFESFYCWTVIITYRVSQKYITRNSSYSLKCQFLLHSWYFSMKLLLISVQLEHFKQFERNIDQVGCQKNANIYVKFFISTATPTFNITFFQGWSQHPNSSVYTQKR